MKAIKFYEEDDCGVAEFFVSTAKGQQCADIIAAEISRIYTPGPFCGGENVYAEDGFAWAFFGGDKGTAQITTTEGGAVLKLFVVFPGDEFNAEVEWLDFLPLAKVFFGEK